MASGIKVNEECLTKFQELKSKGTYKYLILKLNDEKTEFVVETSKEGREMTKKKSETAASYSMDEEKATYDEFRDLLCVAKEAKDCRYAVYDFQYETKGTQMMKNKIIFFHWSPDTTPVKVKMLYSSSLSQVKQALQLGDSGVSLQCNDMDDIDRTEVDNAAQKHERN